MNYFGHDYYDLLSKERTDIEELKINSIDYDYFEDISNKKNQIPTKLEPYIASTILNSNFLGMELSAFGSYQLQIFESLNYLEFNVPHTVSLDNAGISEFMIFNLVIPKSVNMCIIECEKSVKKEITLNQLQEYITDKEGFYLYTVCWDFLDNGCIELHLNFATSFYYTNKNKTVSLSLTFFEKDIVSAKLCMPNHGDDFYNSIDEEPPYIRGYDRYKKIFSIIDENFIDKEYILI